MTEHESGADILARIKPQRRERGTGICMRPDLVDDWHDLNDELTASRVADASNTRLGSGGVSKRSKEIAAAVRKLEDEINATQVRFVFLAMGKDRYSELCDENPPRDNNMLDMATGYNREAVNDASVRECLVSPTFEDCTKPGCSHDTCGSWQAFAKIINPTEWAELVNTCQEVNGLVGHAPKSALASQILDKGARSSRQRASGE